MSAVRKPQDPESRPIRRLFIHCSATKPSMDHVDAEWLRRIHVDENGWDDIGYHYVIGRDGRIERGRDPQVAGAHARGHNHDSLAVCLAGGIDEAGRPDCNFTADQWGSLRALVVNLLASFPDIQWIGGHRDVDSTKACPTFDVKAWAEGMV